MNSKRPERDRMVFQVLRAIRGKSAGEIARAAAKKGVPISASTVRNWRKPIEAGGTRYPQHFTMAAALKAVGMKFMLVSVDEEKIAEAKAKVNGGAHAHHH